MEGESGVLENVSNLKLTNLQLFCYIDLMQDNNNNNQLFRD